MAWFAEYGMFLLKVATLVGGILIVVAGLVAIAMKAKDKEEGQLTVKKLNDHYNELADTLNKEILDKKEYKKMQRADKKAKKIATKDKSDESTSRVFVINFRGDVKASAVNQLREEITAILSVATSDDEVVVIVESGGGMVPHYGLAANQLQRIRDKNIYLTVCVDKIAASGGYLMACVANRLLAAPYAYVGSIGVVAQMPNFNRWLRKKHIDFELHTAGDDKRTLTLFGENTRKDREKFQHEIMAVHEQFKSFIAKHRPQVDIEEVGTGKHWTGSQALEHKLIDDLVTSDDYLFSKKNDADIYEVAYKAPMRISQKIFSSLGMLMNESRYM